MINNVRFKIIAGKLTKFPKNALLHNKSEDLTSLQNAISTVYDY